MGLRGPIAKSIDQVWHELQCEADYSEGDCWLIHKGCPIGIGYRSRRANNKYWYVHHIADFMARGKAPPNTVRLHSCDNPNCINPEHIKRGTHADNVADKVAKSRHMHGETHYRAKLTEEQAREIKYAEGTYAELGRKYGISRGGIHNIKSGISWGHIK